MHDFFLMDTPTQVSVQTEDGWKPLTSSCTQGWCADDIQVVLGDPATVSRAPLQQERADVAHARERTVAITTTRSAVQRVALSWNVSWPAGSLFLGDHWERGYGDLLWQCLQPERVMPWYFLSTGKSGTSGYGVRTGPNALCFWQADATRVRLFLDVRCGGRGVLLNGQLLQAATLVERHGLPQETPFEAASRFCRVMCPNPLLPKDPVYGGNNWYYAYGNSSEVAILDDTRRIADWAASLTNRPFMVVDACWQEIFIRGGSASGGPYQRGNARFPDMSGLAARMTEAGTRPGLWFRPLLTAEALPASWFLRNDRFSLPYEGEVLDPSLPDVLAHIGRDAARMAQWGFQLLKHDFSTFDLLGRWGFDMGASVTNGGWSFADRSQTTAQIIRRLYDTIREATRPFDTLLIGCNTIGHLAAGNTHIQRTGDDTSGREWERTRKMGINTLAFRMPQHGAFFAADADCVGLTREVPWELNRQWLDLLARSGTPLFVSADPAAVETVQANSIREAFRLASLPQAPAEPLDWLETTCPRLWLSGQQEPLPAYDWTDPNGHLAL